MESTSLSLGSKGLIRKHEFVRVMIQFLYSFGYQKSALCLEAESGISYKSTNFKLLESQILSGDWCGCIDTINSIGDIMDDVKVSALFLVFKQWLSENTNSGDDKLALAILRKKVSAFCFCRDKIHKLAYGIISSTSLNLDKSNDNVIHELRKKLLRDLERTLPPPVCLPDRRLEQLVETTVVAQIDSCMYHNFSSAVSIYEDHCCDRDQIPTETIQVLTEHKNEVWFVQFSNNGEFLASSSSDCSAIIWKVSEDGELKLRHALKSHQKQVSFVAWSPDDTKLLTCGHAEVLKLWDVETGTCNRTFEDHGFTVSSCAWFPDSKRFACGSADPEKGIHVWDCDGNEIKAWRGSRMPKIVDLAVTPDGENLISILLDKEIRICNLKTNTERVISEKHSISSLSISGDGKFFIVNLNSQEIHMWDVAGEWKQPLKYTGHQQHIYVIRSCFGGVNSAFIASGSENSEVYIWNRRLSKPIEVLSGHSTTVNCVSWNPKRPKMLASASDDQTIRIWGPKSSKNVKPESFNEGTG